MISFIDRPAQDTIMMVLECIDTPKTKWKGTKKRRKKEKGVSCCKLNKYVFIYKRNTT